MHRAVPSNRVLQTARALADETRLRILASLLESDATVTELSERLGLEQPRVSSHLGVLKDARLVTVSRQGRQRLYQADPERAGLVYGALETAAEWDSGEIRAYPSDRGERVAPSMREARTCYDHLAGVAGVELLDALLNRGFLLPCGGETSSRPEFRLTTVGETMLFARGVRIDEARRSRRRFACACVDWTENRPHLAGALGAAMLDALRQDGLVAQLEGTRAVEIRGSIADWLDETFKASIQAWSDGASEDPPIRTTMEELR